MNTPSVTVITCSCGYLLYVFDFHKGNTIACNKCGKIHEIVKDHTTNSVV